MMETFFVIVLSVLLTLGVMTYIRKFQFKNKSQRQAVILLDKIKSVCKLITVEGDFAEIYHYENVKERFLKLVSSKKKALLVINAKAYVGFDLNKIEINADIKNRTIKMNQFPRPEVLSIETNLNYYDKKDGMFNKFAATDLTTLQKEAKQHILDKIPESGLLNTAEKEALDAILLIENIVQTIGWKLDYSSLIINQMNPKAISE